MDVTFTVTTVAAVSVLKHRIRQPILAAQPVQRDTKHFHFPILVRQGAPRIPNFQSKAQRIRATRVYRASRLVVPRALSK